MSQFQSIFKRYEKKYILTSQQKQKILEAAKPYLAKDKYFHSTICSIYYDTPSRLMIRNSIENATLFSITQGCITSRKANY